MTRIPKEVQAYLDIIDGGEVRTCKEQKQLAALIRKTFRDEDLRVDYEAIEKYMSFQKYFPFDLFPWEKFVFVLHNCVFKQDGRPRWPELFIYCGRGTGKNGYLTFAGFAT